MSNFDDGFKDFDKKLDRAWKFAGAWFVFVGLLALGSMVGFAYVVFLLLQHFGIL